MARTIPFFLFSQRSGYLPNSVPLASVTRVNEEERKRIEREQQRLGRPELREREKITPIATFSPYVHNVQVIALTLFSYCEILGLSF